eukprot:sb/3474812/
MTDSGLQLTHDHVARVDDDLDHPGMQLSDPQFYFRGRCEVLWKTTKSMSYVDHILSWAEKCGLNGSDPDNPVCNSSEGGFSASNRGFSQKKGLHILNFLKLSVTDSCQELCQDIILTELVKETEHIFSKLDTV